MNIVTVRHPELTAEERARRMEQIKQATVQLFLATEKAKQRKLNKANT